jgi:hypothetical protein
MSGDEGKVASGKVPKWQGIEVSKLGPQGCDCGFWVADH